MVELTLLAKQVNVFRQFCPFKQEKRSTCSIIVTETFLLKNFYSKSSESNRSAAGTSRGGSKASRSSELGVLTFFPTFSLLFFC